MPDYVRPETIAAALAALRDGPRTILAGGTDLYPAWAGRPPGSGILDITAIAELDDIARTEDGYRIGAMVRWSELAAADLPPGFDGLRDAARQIGGPQVQNAGTVCGNLCNASPAADGIPNLLVLDASVELASADGRRNLPLAEFVTGNRSTARRPDEIVTALLVPPPPAGARSAFSKLGARAHLVISIAMVAVLLAPGADGTVAEARVAVGACSPVAQRLTALEETLRGAPFGPAIAALPEATHLAALSPIDDIRASAAYRFDAVLTIIRRTLAELAGEPR